MKSRIIATTVLLLIIIYILPIKNVFAASKEEHITIKNFVERTVKETGIGKTYKDAINAGIVQSGDFINTRKNLTNQDAAIILDRTWNVLYGDTDNKKIKTKEWLLRPHFVFKIKNIDLPYTMDEDELLFKIKMVDIKAKQEEVLNKLREKYSQYTFVPSNELIEKGNYDEKDITYNIDNQDMEITFAYAGDWKYECTFCMKFNIKEKCYNDNEFSKMLKDMNTNFNVTFDEDNSKYYNMNLSYDIMKGRIKENNRISDVENAKVNNQDAIYSMYSKGVMTGYSNGYYVTNRSFKPARKSSLFEAKVWISRMAGEKVLRTFSPEGMLVRVTNLPFNSNEWKYILEDVPNDFYLMRYEYEHYGDFNNLYKIRKEAILPANFYNKYYHWTGIEGNRLNTVINSVYDNLKLQLNISYKTINNEWKKAFYKSVSDRVSLIDISTTKEYYKKGKVCGTITYNSRSVLNYYMKYVKKHKIVIKSNKIYVDPNSIYMGDKWAYIRCYVRFRVNWSGKMNDVNNLVFPGKYYSNNIEQNYLTGLKKGKYIECMVDEPIDLNVSYKYQLPTIYGGIEVGYLKSIQYMKIPDYYNVVCIKTRQLKIKKMRILNHWEWKWE